MAMTANELIAAVREIEKLPTIYAKGGVATYVTAANIASLRKHYPDWYYASKVKERFVPIYDKGVWCFDCSGLLKAAFWGFNRKKVYHAVDEWERLVPDFPVGKLSDVQKIADMSEDFRSILPGELLFTPGHVGLYVGDGLAIECTPTWSGGVQYTAVGNIGKRDGYNTRTWKYHGKFKCVSYKEETEEVTTVTIEMKVLKKGMKDNQAKTLQRLLRSYGYKDQNGEELEIDGSFGGKTDYAVRAFQKAKGLTVDGSVGPATWGALLHG